MNFYLQFFELDSLFFQENGKNKKARTLIRLENQIGMKTHRN
jgi:hypothetical protein